MANAKPKPKSLLDLIEEVEDVEVEVVTVPEWNNMAIEFRGLSLAAMEAVQGKVDLVGATEGNISSVVTMIQMTAADPETHELIFDSERGAEVLRKKNHAVLLRLLNEGALKVLGVDAAETPGKG